MKTLSVALTLLTTTLITNAQTTFGLEAIEDIVTNEQEYFNGILEIYRSDDPYIRTDDIALVYYGQAFRNVGRDSAKGGKLLKEHYKAGNFKELYSAATAMLEENPASLTALFHAWIAARETGRSHDEARSYVNKFNRIVTMITEYGTGKNSSSPFRVIHPDDQQFVMTALGIEKSFSDKFDTETLCNIHVIKPTEDFKASVIYFDLSLFLKQKATE